MTNPPINKLKEEITDLKQLVFKLQNNLKQARWDNAHTDITFLQEMYHEFKQAWDGKDITRYEKGMKMIEDWIHELKNKPEYVND